jgi:hypothetical protein
LVGFVRALGFIRGGGPYREEALGGGIAGRDLTGSVGGRIGRGRFLKLAGLGAGLSLFPGSLFPMSAAGAQTIGEPEILADGRYPIGLWWPPPPEQTSNERYAEISAAGFNFVIGGNGVGTDDENSRALDAASANGLRFLLTDSRLRRIINDSTNSAAAATTSEAGTPSPMRYLLEQEGTEASSRTASEPGERDGTYSAAASTEDEVSLRIQELLNLHAGNPALAGLNLYDEPGSDLFQILGVARQALQNQAPGELPYVNVWPSYAHPSALGTATYEEYLDRYMRTVQPPLLCFDHYPLLSGGGITGDYFYNWATIRKVSLQFGVPSWVFIQSVDFDSAYPGFQDRRSPNEAEIRWQVNVSLAYGAKGIQYFTYWTPDSQPGDPLRFRQALIASGGTQTALYDHAKKVNAYLEVMGKALLPLVSDSVVHAREKRLPRGAKPFRADGYVSAVSGSPLILGRFLRPGVPDVRYFFVANRSPARVAESRLALSRSVRGVYRLDIGADKFVKVSPQAADGRRYLGLKLARGEARLYRLHT